MEHKYKEFPMQKSEGDAGTISGYFSTYDRIPDSWKQVGNELTEFNRFFERCLSTFKNNKSQINAFISLCSGKQHMLGKSQGRSFKKLLLLVSSAVLLS